MDEFLYHYEARLVSVYDGDTIRVDLSLGFNIWQLNKPIRQADDLIIETHKDTTGKYGRLLGTVHYRVEGQWHNLNQELLNQDLAAAYPD